MELLTPQIAELVASYLAEDIGRGDLTSRAVLDAGATGSGRIEAREPCVVAGLQAAAMCFELLADEPMDWSASVDNGERVSSGATIAEVSGSLHVLLAGERTALNLLQRLSGIATLTSAYVAAIADTPARIVDTRKTTPGMRLLEKQAVVAGGASNHRFGLDDGVLIKDNHLVALGGDIEKAVARARTGVPHGVKIEVEVVDLEQLDAAIAAGADIVMLDNMSPEMVAEAAKRAGGKVLLEASGGIELPNVRDYALAGADLISVGALTHSAPSVDIALELE